MNQELENTPDDQVEEQSAEVDVAAVVEAMLFSTDTPLTAKKVADVGRLAGQREVKKAVETLNDRYRQAGCAFYIEQLAGGYQMMTLPQYNEVLSRLFQARKETRLSQAAMETLSVIAYRQPVMRADIEAIRGVACGEVLRGLLDKQLVKIVGRAEVLGRPMLYGPTKYFLKTFGLADLEHLPNVAELRGGDKPPPPTPDPPVEKEELEEEREEASESEDQQDTAPPDDVERPIDNQIKQSRGL